VAVPARGPAATLCGRAMADVPDGSYRADAGAGASLSALRAGADPLCDRSLHERGAATLRRPEPPLEANPWLAGEYSLADMAVFPWIGPHRWQGQSLDDFPNLRRWYDAISERPAVQRGLAVLHDRLERNRAKPTGGRGRSCSPASRQPIHR
jgi:glutathione S-transferase